MFSQQQLQQQLLQLQQLLQPPPPPPQPPPPPPSRGLAPPQQQQILNLRPGSQASLLSANPMLQHLLLLQQMQGNLRGFNMAAAPVLQQFFPQATRHSLLGPPPVGVSMKPVRLAFPALPFPWQNRTFRKEFSKIPDRKREADAASSSSHGQGTDEAGPILEASDSQEESEPASSLPSETLPTESPNDSQPAAKRLRSEIDDTVPEETQAEEAEPKAPLEETDEAQKILAEESPEERNVTEELKTSEVVNSAGSLKVTIQQSSESRAISTTALKPAPWNSETGAADSSPESPLKFYCYICKMDCCNQQNFQSHMSGVQHRQCLQNIQHMSNLCFVSLLPVVKEQRPVSEKDGEGQQRWCNTCQGHFTGDLIKHRRTPEHKLAKRSLRPVCTVCSRHFKTPRKFVEHMKSPAHKQKAKEAKSGEKEQGGPEDSEELITVDAVGCFEEEEEEEDGGEDEDSEGEPQDHKEPLSKQAGPKETSLEDGAGNEEYCPDTVYGPDFLVPAAGYLCRLCHKFYQGDSDGRFTHCKSLMHFENFQRYKATKLQAAPAQASLNLRPDGLATEDKPESEGTPEPDKEDGSVKGDDGSPGEEEEAQTHNLPATESYRQVAEDGAGPENWPAAAGDASSCPDVPGRGGPAEQPGEPPADAKPDLLPDQAAKETAGGHAPEQEPGTSSPAKGEPSGGCRRSTRHRAR